MIYFAAFTDTGAKLAARLAFAFGEEAQAVAPPACAEKNGLLPIDGIRDYCGTVWNDADAIVFIGAAGIAVRAIAPYVKSKKTDPAVVVVDEKGSFVISLLSGHIGGGNDLTYRIAELSGGTPVITTATDVNGRFAVDIFAKDNGLIITSMEKAKAVSAAILRNEAVGFFTEYDHEELPRGLAETEEKRNIEIGYRTERKDSLLLIPRKIWLGIGCRRGTESGRIRSAVQEFLRKEQIPEEAVAGLASIDLKSDEQGLLAYAKEQDLPIRFFSAEELDAVQGSFSESDFVKKTTGVGCVCERAAVLASGNGKLIGRKDAGGGVTAACAEEIFRLKIRKDT